MRNKSLHITRRALLFTASLFLSGAATADSPSGPRGRYVSCSANMEYCAFVSVADGVDIFRMRANNVAAYPTTKIEGWHPASYISDDGKIFITVESTIVPSFRFDQPIINIWIDGKLTKSLLVSEVSNRKAIKKTSSGYTWGDPIGFDSNNVFALRLADRSIMRIQIDGLDIRIAH